MRANVHPAAAVLAFLAFGLFAPEASALEHLDGEAARARIGDPKKAFASGGYVYEILSRSHRDAMNGRFSDGLIFTKATDRLYYQERGDGHHVVVVGDPRGREENPVTTDAVVWRPIENALQDDHPDPHVFLDGDREIAVVYIGKRTELRGRLNDQGFLELTLNVRSQSRMGPRMRMR
jgi:hypothetical protein